MKMLTGNTMAKRYSWHGYSRDWVANDPEFIRSLGHPVSRVDPTPADSYHDPVGRRCESAGSLMLVFAGVLLAAAVLVVVGYSR
jgi:hypothetical protein